MFYWTDFPPFTCEYYDYPLEIKCINLNTEQKRFEQFKGKIDAVQTKKLKNYALLFKHIYVHSFPTRIQRTFLLYSFTYVYTYIVIYTYVYV